MYNNGPSQPMMGGPMGGPMGHPMGHPMGMGGPMMMGPGPGMMPPGPGAPMMMGGSPGHQGMTGYDPIHMSVAQIFNMIPTGVFVKQQFDAIEAITGCDTKNKYYVYEQTRDGGSKKKRLFKAKEESGWCVRNCMSADCKPFDMKIKKCAIDPDYDNDETVILLERDCKCTFLCCNRPELKVYLTENGQKVYLGKIVDSWDCINYSYTVYDAHDKVRFFIKASCCQLGFWCKCPCEACERIEFDLWSGDKEKPEAPILKTGTGNCIKNAVGSADYFSVTFPTLATWEDKALLMSSVLMIDFMQFEEKNGGNGQNNL